MPSIDLNCDMGEGMSSDAALMDVVTSINIACGFHAGGLSVMRRTVDLAIQKDVNIGAHPSYLDTEGFGRRPMELSPDEVFDIVVYQVSALKGICETSGGVLTHVKPHGALYNTAAKHIQIANAIAKAVAAIDADLVLFGLSGSHSITQAEACGLRTASEVFADRTYTADGSLTPRTEADALITDTARSVAQVIQMIRDGSVSTTNGEVVPIVAETVCIHGDGPHALEFAVAVRDDLIAHGVSIKGF